MLASQLMTIKPRKYSIASAPGLSLDTEKTGNNLSLIVGVLEYNTETGRVKRGLTTGMLETMSLNTRVLGSIKTEINFKLPEDPTWPVRTFNFLSFCEICFEVIMICAGSGIAPFRGFWMRRYEQCQQGHRVGQTFLYFGCRKKTMNLLQSETDQASNSNKG